MPWQFGLRRALLALSLMGMGWVLTPPAAAQATAAAPARGAAHKAAALARLEGVVVSGDGAAIVGAHISSPSDNTTSDAAGKFSIAASSGATLAVTAAGFAPRRLPARPPLRIVLSPAPVAEQVTVTATARNQDVVSVPVLTTIQGPARLQTSASNTFDTIAQAFTDLQTFRRTSALVAHPTSEGVSMLGVGSSGASRALVLVDGLPLNDAFGDWIDWLRVPQESMGEVSAVSGAASPLYGNDALTGVVEVNRRVPPPESFSLRTAGGGLGTGLVDGIGSVGGERLNLTFSGRSLKQQGYVPNQPAGRVDSRAGVTANELNPELRWTPSERASFALSGEYFGEHRRNGTRLAVNATALRQVALRGTVDAGGLWRVTAFDQSEDFSSTFSSVAEDRNSEKLVLEQQVPSRSAGAAVNWSGQWRSLRGVVGGSWTRVSAVDFETAPLAHRLTMNNGRQRLGGAFAELEWQPRQRLLLVGTLRGDRWRNYDAFTSTATTVTADPALSSSAVSPSLGLRYALLPHVSLRASGYEAFRAPSLNELYRPFRVGNVLTLANPLLAAERYRGVQAGADLELPGASRLRLTWFDGRAANMISNLTLAVTKTQITRQRTNVGRIRPRGETAELESSPASWLTVWGSYTHVASHVESAVPATLVGLRVAHVPANNADFRALARWRGWEFSPEERFGGREFDDDQNLLQLPGYWTTDVYLGRALTEQSSSWAHGLTPYLAVQNLWNRRVPVALTPTAYMNAPRVVMVGLRIVVGAE